MNNRLFAILLSFTITPFFATSHTQTIDEPRTATIQQASATEIVEYLQILKGHLLAIISECEEASQELKEEYGSQLYEEITNINHDLYAVVVPEEVIAYAQIDFSFNDFTHEELEDAKKISFEAVFGDLMYKCPQVGPYELQPDQEKQVKAIFARYGKDDSKPATDLINEYFLTEDNWAISLGFDMIRYINMLLPKIDAKIAELACPSKL